MKCAIVLNNTIVNLIIVDEAAAGNLQQFADAAGPGHTAEPLTAEQALTAWIGATRTSNGWSDPIPVVLPVPSTAELEAQALEQKQGSDLKAVVAQQAKELDEIRMQIAKIIAGTSAP